MDLLCRDDITNHRKKEIVYEMLAKYPENDKLYYYMACISSKNVNKALFWHKLCFCKNPNNIENFLDYMKLLYDTSQIDEITKFNEENDNILHRIANIDNRVKLLYATYEIKRKNTTFGIRLFLEIMNVEDDPNIRTICCSNLGFVYINLGYYDKGIYFYEQISKNITKIHLDNLLMAYDYRYGYEFQSKKQYEKYNLLFGTKTEIFQKKTQTNNKIRIGYVSGDFDIHVISNFFLPILQYHDRNKFEIHLFANSPVYTDFYGNERCHYIQQMTTEEAAQLIKECEIDILIDLSGHTEYNRLDVFAIQPAPIQITYLGFPNTTGMKNIQYRITDEFADSLDTTQYYSEQLVRLPCCFLCFKSLLPRIPIKQKDKSRVVLGSLNKECKISNECMAVWRDILQECPNTIILIKQSYHNYNNKELYLSGLGIMEDRLILLEYQDLECDYNDLFSQIDVLLDTFPYSGTTTTCKALFNSVPVITMYHPNIHAHNVSSSILKHSGLDKYVAYSRDEYVRIAKDLVYELVACKHDTTIGDKFAEAMNPMRFIECYENALMDCLEKM